MGGAEFRLILFRILIKRYVPMGNRSIAVESHCLFSETYQGQFVNNLLTETIRAIGCD